MLVNWLFICIIAVIIVLRHGGDRFLRVLLVRFIRCLIWLIIVLAIFFLIL